jgi:hypothetical protein
MAPFQRRQQRSLSPRMAQSALALNAGVSSLAAALALAIAQHENNGGSGIISALAVPA